MHAHSIRAAMSKPIPTCANRRCRGIPGQTPVPNLQLWEEDRNNRQIEHRARPRRASATAPLRSGGHVQNRIRRRQAHWGKHRTGP